MYLITKRPQANQLKEEKAGQSKTSLGLILDSNPPMTKSQSLEKYKSSIAGIAPSL